MGGSNGGSPSFLKKSLQKIWRENKVTYLWDNKHGEQMKIQNHLDVRFLRSEVGTIVEYPDGSKEQVIFKTTDKVDSYFLTQIQTNHIKKNGELGRLTTWLKFRHHK